MNAACRDCGEPIHPAPACAVCGLVWYHDSGRAALLCPGPGPHVTPAALPGGIIP